MVYLSLTPKWEQLDFRSGGLENFNFGGGVVLWGNFAGVDWGFLDQI